MRWLLVDVWQELAGFWHVLSQAHIMFYIVLIALSFFPLLPHRGEISNRLKQLRNGTHHAEPAGFQQPGVPEC